MDKNYYSKEWARMVSGKLYNAADAGIDVKHLKGMSLCEKFNKIPLKKTKKKQRALEKLIPSAVGMQLAVFAPFYCEYGQNITVGKGCFVNYNCIFLDCAPITLGDFVWLGANITLATPMHPLLSDERIFREYPDGYHDLEYTKPITIIGGRTCCVGIIRASSLNPSLTR